MPRSWQADHGHKGNSNWPAPKLAAEAKVANRPDQGNKTLANEYLDHKDVFTAKVELMAHLIRESKFCIAYTGAGLSKAAGIPDYATKATKSLVAGPKLTSSMDAAPTYSHFALTALERAGLLKAYVQQNHDGLPQKSGFPQTKMNEIHGAWFDPSNPVVKFSGSLRDDLFDDMLQTEHRADLCLCLGTSLSGMNADRVAETPAQKGLSGQALGTIIINLQRTRLDDISAVRIWAKLDDTFQRVAEVLGVIVKTVPPAFVGGDVFTIPYDHEGKRSDEVRTVLDLRRGQKIRIPIPQASTYNKVAEVVGKDHQGHFLLKFKERQRRLGRWWIECALSSAVEQLPVVNIEPRVVDRLPVLPAKPAPQPVVPEAPVAEPPTLTEAHKEDEHEQEHDSESEDELESSASFDVCVPSTPEPPPLPATLSVVQSHHTLEGSRSQHSWGLRLEDSAASFVEQVEWRLHPSFRHPNVTCTTVPFAISRKGWGSFTVDFLIKLKPHYGGATLRGKHELTFEGEGDAVSVIKIRTA
eukprot:TRINITY_DN14066_c0_g1_i1.p1 TRINITY_DN14066_c0_g1~~TRINITY_DN14066_c0_g1_i1.p1  ORF type:complete len:536 (-),score=59.75 TRINITY_DN14066_c0_g1_i1:4-1584(-)